MKFTITRKLLHPSLQKVVGIVDRKQAMPILDNVLLVCEQDRLILTGTDIEIQLLASIKLNPDETGKTTVSARKLLDIIHLLPTDADIKFNLVKDKLKITSSRGKFSLSTLNPEHYPEFSPSEIKHKFTIKTATIQKALNKTVFCMGSQDVRYYLNGLLLCLDTNNIKLVASDGHRLSFHQENITIAIEQEERIIIPRKGVLGLLGLLDDAEDISIQISENHIEIECNAFVFSSKLVDAKYPDFNRIFDEKFSEPIKINKEMFKNGLNLVAILANEKFKGVSCYFADNTLKLSTHNPEHDEAEQELSLEYTAEPLSIDFNCQYLLDAINNIDGEFVLLTVSDNNKSCLIQEAQDQPYKFIVMPMRL